MLAALHGPIEEQARLSICPCILLWFVHAQSKQWLRRILRRETEEARSRLRGWQERVLAAVQSMQLDSAALAATRSTTTTTPLQDSEIHG